jgi:hypothetical protein
VERRALVAHAPWGLGLTRIIKLALWSGSARPTRAFSFVGVAELVDALG